MHTSAQTYKKDFLVVVMRILPLQATWNKQRRHFFDLYHTIGELNLMLLQSSPSVLHDNLRRLKCAAVQTSNSEELRAGA